MGKLTFLNKEKTRKIFTNNKFIIIITFLLSMLSLLATIITTEAKDKNILKIEAIDTIYISSIRIGETDYPLKVFVSDGIILEENKLIIEKGKSLELEASKILSVRIEFFNDIEFKCNLQLNDKQVDPSFENNSNIYTYNTRILSNIQHYFSNIDLNKVIFLLVIAIISFILIYFSLTNILKFMFTDIKVNYICLIIFFISLTLLYILCFHISLQIFGWFLIVPLFILMCTIVLFYKDELRKNLNKLFIIFGTVFGLYMAFVLPPFHVPDEASHFFKAYSIFSNEDIQYNQDGNRISKAQLILTSTVQKPIDKYNMDIFNSYYTISAKEYFVDLTYFLDKDEPSVSFYFGNTFSLPDLCYLPSAIVTYLSLKIGLPFMLAPLLSRITNLLIFVICGYFALTITPRFKNILFAVMLLPIALQQAIGINQDSITNSIIFVTVALLLNYIYRKDKITKLSFINIFTLSILLGFCKIGYYPILFLIFLIPSNKFTSRKTEILFKILPLLPCLLLSFKQYFVTATNSSGVEEIYYPISTIFKNPLLITKICINTIFARLSLDLLTGLVDGFGWSTVWHRSLIQFIASTLYFLVFMVSGEMPEKNQKKHRFVFGFITLLMFGMIYGSLLFGWTRVGMNIIDGLQCRYFIPIALFLYITLSNKLISIKNKDNFVVLSICIVNTLAFFTIINSYYI